MSKEATQRNWWNPTMLSSMQQDIDRQHPILPRERKFHFWSHSFENQAPEYLTSLQRVAIWRFSYNPVA